MSTKEIIKDKKTNETKDFSSDSYEINNDDQSIKSSKKLSKTSITRVKFLPSEDKDIIELVSKYGTNWKVISQYFGPTRTKRQLRERWQNYLNPDCNPTYTNEEDNMLIDLVNELGTKWAKIAEIIGKKSAISCRNRHRILIKEINKKSNLKHSESMSENNSDESDSEKQEKTLNKSTNEDLQKSDSGKDKSLFNDLAFDDLVENDDTGSLFFCSTFNEDSQSCFDYNEFFFDCNLYYDI